MLEQVGPRQDDINSNWVGLGPLHWVLLVLDITLIRMNLTVVGCLSAWITIWSHDFFPQINFSTYQDHYLCFTSRLTSLKLMKLSDTVDLFVM